MSALNIQWGEVPFENLGPFNGWTGPGGPGVFVVMVQPNKETAPTDYRALFFGEAENLADSEFFRSHPKFRCCVSEAERADNLFFAALPMPDASPVQRKQVQRLLIDEFHPVCNW
jgi:hypothetical protein